MNTEQIIDFLLKGIETDEIVNNEKLKSERELAEMMNISRASLRPALSKLEQDGVIWRRRGRGTFVGVPQDQGLDDLINVGNRTSAVEIIEVRRELEPILVKLAAIRSTPQQRENLLKALKQTQNAKNAAEYERWDAIFHRVIAESANNQLFLAMFDAIQEVRHQDAWSNMRESRYSKESQKQLVDQHEKIYQAIIKNSPAEAEKEMREHIELVSVKFTT